MARQPPDLNIPVSDVTVDVSIINTTCHVGAISTAAAMEPHVFGFDHLNCPCYSFLIQHPSGQKLLFDLGIRKDWHNLPPAVANRLEASDWVITTLKDVREILESEDIDPNQINGIIWSHFHWDHTGDPSRFPSTTDLIVGPGFKEAFMPGYPENSDAKIHVSDYANRKVHEIDFKSNPIEIGSFPAYDFFGDGSFYLLDSPGHTQAHICGLARTTAEPGNNTFMLMGGDFAHHGGEFRPSPYLPIPLKITPHPFPDRRSCEQACPGSIFAKVHGGYSNTKKPEPENWSIQPFFRPIANFSHDVEQCIDSIKKVQEVDGHDEVMVVMAHDEAVLDSVEFFPKKANDWKQKGWGNAMRWAFLKDFQKGVQHSEK